MDRSFFKNVTLLQRKPVVFATVNDISIICSCTLVIKQIPVRCPLQGHIFTYMAIVLRGFRVYMTVSSWTAVVTKPLSCENEKKNSRKYRNTIYIGFHD
jgi:hypothetical protein